MIYLDYSATTKVDNEVLKSFNDTITKYYANPNSMHDFGVSTKKIVDESTNKIANLLGVLPGEIIYTSGSSEANNTAIKGVLDKYNIKKIITTKLEHSSINAPVAYLQQKGIKVEFLELDQFGLIDINDLISRISNENILVTICAVNSELGIKQNVNEIGKILAKYSNVIFHSDITQLIGKDEVNLDYVDMASLSMHKIYGFKGFGILVKKNNIKIEPLIMGGKSTSVYRSGTPQTGLIVAMEKALDIAVNGLNDHKKKVAENYEYLINKISNIKDIYLNSNSYSIKNIVNISVMKNTAKETQKYFSVKGIYISTQTACAINDESFVVKELTNDSLRARTSIRISLSYLTTKEEIDVFAKTLHEYLEVK